jgi:hypothetical protein
MADIQETPAEEASFLNLPPIDIIWSRKPSFS